MIIVKIHGGLGNQLFQYSLGRSLSLKLGTKLKLDLSVFETDKKRKYELDKFNIVAEIASKNEVKKFKSIKSLVLSKLSKYLTFLYGKSAYISEKKYGFDSRVMDLPNNRYFEGYWQSEKYFLAVAEKIRHEFMLKKEAESDNLKMLVRILRTPDSVCLHVRRGDYAAENVSRNFHGTCDLNYYKEALDVFAKKINKPVFFVFSDDIDWVKDNLPIEHDANYVDINSGEKGYEDLRLMSACNNFIIANSSFSWWGAWLSDNKDKIVIAPKKWFATQESDDLIPNDWIRL